MDVSIRYYSLYNYHAFRTSKLLVVLPNALMVLMNEAIGSNSRDSELGAVQVNAGSRGCR
jgi:hypothetical protein